MGVKKMGEYENVLTDIENTLGEVPGFMRFFSKDEIIQDWPSWKADCCRDINIGRACYLLCIDALSEENLK